MRCFVAVWPPPEILALLAQWERPSLPAERIRFTTPDQWHVTLRFLGDIVPGTADRLAIELERTTRETTSGVVATAGPRLRLLGPGLVVWPVTGLADLASLVAEITADLIDPAQAGRPFVGHLTIARARGGTDLRRYRRRLCVPLSAEWPVGAISLVASDLRPEGAAYRELASFPLGRAQPA